MPQLDFSTYLSQIFWLSISFFLLYFFVSFVFLPRLNAILQQRKNLIAQANADANKMEAEMQDKIKKREQAVGDAKFAAQHIIAEAYTFARTLKEDALLSFAKKDREVVKKNQMQIAQFKQDSKNEMKRIAFDITIRYHNLIFGDGLKNKVVDFAEMKNAAYKGVEELPNNGNGKLWQ